MGGANTDRGGRGTKGRGRRAARKALTPLVLWVRVHGRGVHFLGGSQVRQPRLLAGFLMASRAQFQDDCERGPSMECPFTGSAAAAWRLPCPRHEARIEGRRGHEDTGHEDTRPHHELLLLVQAPAVLALRVGPQSHGGEEIGERLGTKNSQCPDHAGVSSSASALCAEINDTFSCLNLLCGLYPASLW